jgi:chemotaxis protein methyltransferase CheR
MGSSAQPEFDIELHLLLEGIYLRYQHDFRQYATASLRRRLSTALTRFGVATLSGLQERVLRDATAFQELLPFLTVQVSEMFRDPPFFRALREEVVPWLRTFPSLKVWVAGCGNGEEVYALAVLLREEGLLDRTLVYATDVSPQALEAAQAGIYDLERFATFSKNYLAAGGRASLSDYYTAAYGAAALDRSLRANIVFTDHSLATDNVFAEVQLVTCRNVLIYFKPELQERSIGLFRESLCHKGFLGLGAGETLRFSTYAQDFEPVLPAVRIYRRR